jgi:hypothetical protein
MYVWLCNEGWTHLGPFRWVAWSDVLCPPRPTRHRQGKNTPAGLEIGRELHA